MTREVRESLQGSTWGQFADQIVENSQRVLGYPYVFLTQCDLNTGQARCVAWAGLHLTVVKRTLQAVKVALPNFDPLGASAPIDANPFTAQVYRNGEVVNRSALDIVQGAVPDLVVHFAQKIVGVDHVLMVPLQLEGHVYGALVCCHNEAHVPEHKLDLARAFASQVAFGLHNAELRRQQELVMQELQASREMLTQAEERTRQQVSEHLHSRVQSRLLVAWYRLGQVKTKEQEVQHTLNQVRDELEHIREHEVRLLSHQLHPEALDVGLIAALQLLVHRMQHMLDVHIQVDSKLLKHEEENQGLSASSRLVAFRVIEEALGNTIKHAKARNATVTLRLQNNTLFLEVQDDGIGFDPKRALKGLGLRWMDARIKQVEGTWGVDSQKGGPSRIWARIPS